jgi:predicted transcriptional regulator YdeE
MIPTGEFGALQLRKGKYAVYTLKGSYSGLQGLYNSISINFPHSLRHGMAFEEYVNSPFDTKGEENFLTKIFIPVKSSLNDYERIEQIHYSHQREYSERAYLLRYFR